jgi:hypothetical protein
MAVSVIALLVAIAALTDSPSDTMPGPEDAAPVAAVADEEAVQERDSSGDDTVTQPVRDNEPTVTAKGSDGKTYLCPADALDRIDAANDKVTRRKKVLKARRAAVRKLEKQYPSGTAPSAVVDRYDRLVARENAQVTWVNKAVREYNGLLRSECTAD